jgi:hypothetical protein
MEAATVRAIHNAAQEETRALRALEPGGDEANDAAALALVVSLAGRVRALQAATVALAPPQRTIWDQRAGWLHQELRSLAAERLRSPNPDALDGADASAERVLRLVYAAADTARAADAARDAAETARDAALASASEANARADAAESRAAASASASAAAAAAARDDVDLRTKVAVQQQELQRRATEVRELQQRLQTATRERDELSKQVLAAAAEGASGPTPGSGSADAVHDDESRRKLLEANHALSVNLRQHAEVVEKLIGLNSELMDKTNDARAKNDPQTAAGRLAGAKDAGTSGRSGEGEERVLVADGTGTGDSEEEDVRPGGVVGKLGRAWNFLAGDAPPPRPRGPDGVPPPPRGNAPV